MNTYDAKLAKERASGDESLVKRLNKLMLEDIEQQIPIITEAYQKQDWEKLHYQLHRLHGACCYTGFPKLQQLLRTLLDAIKADDIATLVKMQEPLLTSLHASQAAIPV